MYKNQVLGRDYKALNFKRLSEQVGARAVRPPLRAVSSSFSSSPLISPCSAPEALEVFSEGLVVPVAALRSPDNQIFALSFGAKAGAENWICNVLFISLLLCPFRVRQRWCWCYKDICLLTIFNLTGGAGPIQLWHIRNRSLNNARPRIHFTATSHPAGAFPSKVAPWLQFRALDMFCSHYGHSLGSHMGKTSENPAKFTDWVTPGLG